MKALNSLCRLLIAAGMVAVAACSSSSPTEPAPSAPANPKPPVPQVTYTVTVTANPGHLTVGAGNSSSITVQVRRNDTGQPPADATPITLTTTLGEFGLAGSGRTTLNLQLVGGQAQAVLFPGTSAGTATVSATIGSDTGAASVRIDQAGTFFVNSISPSTGDPKGGAVVTISGGGFLAPVRVLFGPNTAQVQSVSGGQIQVVVPAAPQLNLQVGQQAAVDVTVTNNLGGTQQQTATLTGGFIYALGGGGIQQPQVFSVSPASGPNDGGTPVTIVGQGFVAPVQVFFGSGGSATSFNGVEATVQSVTSTQLVVVTPPARGFGQDNTNQLVSILIKNLNSGFSTLAAAAFKYGSRVIVTSVAPGQTIFNQQVKVIVFGQGFADPVAVTLAGVAAQVLSTSGTEVQVLSPIPQISTCANLSGPVRVTNINNGDTGTGPDFVFQVFKPAISSINPTSGTGNGGTQVIITGANFDPNAVRVLFGTQAATINSATSSQLVVTTPQFTGTYPTQACTLGSSTGTQNLPASVNVTVTNLQTTCTDTVNNAFNFLPPDASCHIPPPPPTQKPVASFTFTAVHLKVAFNDTSSNTPTSWTWDFGDGGSSTTENPVHTYGVAGTYLVILDACNSAGCGQASQSVTVTP
ncbi:MAG TPA: IPT/TIG domain-containing protein [Thermoanaerobaculia bacterium]|nr:IPT/TIG domain-containing protein [Thermoanaerobaculia bacterium]